MLQKNELYLGDCLDVMKHLDDESVDMILCDLPYGTTACKWDSIIPFESLWQNYERIIKPNGAIVLTASQPFTTKLITSKIELFRYEWIWEKTQATGHLDAKRRPMKAHENVCVFYKKQPTYNYQKTYGHARKVSTAKHKQNTKTNQTEIYGRYDNFTDYDTTERYPRSVLTFASDKQRISLHPTQKPVALFEYFIKTYTNEGELVLDNCAGSCTTAIACMNTNRNWICIEKEDKYFLSAKQRIEDNKASKNQEKDS
jgi:site-specific DNA-methyltransferase (adenine-specific)